VVNGDVTQVDLPDGRRSGLRVAEKVLANIDGIAFFRFNEHDVVRHNLVQKVITAYDRYEKEQEAEREARKNGGDRRGPRTAREPVEAPLKVQEEG
jgi:phosphate starvation-inducible PhoH-like protein